MTIPTGAKVRIRSVLGDPVFSLNVWTVEESQSEHVSLVKNAQGDRVSLSNDVLELVEDEPDDEYDVRGLYQVLGDQADAWESAAADLATQDDSYDDDPDVVDNLAATHTEAAAFLRKVMRQQFDHVSSASSQHYIETGSYLPLGWQ